MSVDLYVSSSSWGKFVPIQAFISLRQVLRRNMSAEGLGAVLMYSWA